MVHVENQSFVTPKVKFWPRSWWFHWWNSCWIGWPEDGSKSLVEILLYPASVRLQVLAVEGVSVLLRQYPTDECAEFNSRCHLKGCYFCLISLLLCHRHDWNSLISVGLYWQEFLNQFTEIYSLMLLQFNMYFFFKNLCKQKKESITWAHFWSDIKMVLKHVKVHSNMVVAAATAAVQVRLAVTIRVLMLTRR